MATMILNTVFFLAVGACVAGESDDRFFQGLRDRRLFSLAEEHCVSELEAARLTPTRRVELSLELSRTYVEHAQYISGAEQVELWDQAAAVIDNVLATKQILPNRELLAIQRGLVSVSKSAFQRAHCDLFVEDAAARQAGLDAGRDAIQRFRQIESDLEKGRYELSSREKRQLLRNVRLQLGLASLEIAQLQPLDSPDRAEALLNANEWLDQMGERPSLDDAGWNARIGMAVCYRLQGNPGAARREVTALMTDTPTDVYILDRMAAEYVRLLLLDDKAADAGQFFVKHRQRHKRLSGELHLLKVETLMQIRRLAVEHNSAELAKQLDAQLDVAIKHVDLEVGGYWSARCRVLVDRLSESNTLGTEAAELMQSARSQFNAGRTQESAQGYLAAARAAEKSGKSKPAADFRFTAASILLQSKDYANANVAFDLFVTKHAMDERVANASLLKAWSLGRIYNSDRTPEHREAYSASLKNYRERYPETDGAGDAHWMLGQLEEQQRQVVTALELYLQVPAQHRYGPSARLAVCRIYELIFDRLAAESAAPLKVQKWQVRATADLTAMIKRFTEDGPLSYGKAEFLLRTAQVFLKFPSPDYAGVDRLLETVNAAMQTERIDDDELANQRRVSLLAEARRARIVSLAGRKQTAQAALLLNQLATQDSAEFLDVVDGLSKLAEQRNDGLAFELGLLQIKALDLLEARTSNGSNAAVDTRRLKLMRVQALMTTAGYGDAIKLLQQILKTSPKDQTIMAQLAAAYEAANRKESIEKSHAVWKRVESMNKPGSVAWCDARYHVARLGLKLGLVTETQKLLKVTRLLYPNLGNAEISARFSELEKTIGRSKVGSP